MKSHRALLIGPLIGAAVGLGDGVVGQSPITDKYRMAHTVYRLAVATTGAVAIAADFQPDAAAHALTAAVTLLASRVPAVIAGHNLAQFGYVAPLKVTVPRAAGQHIH